MMDFVFTVIITTYNRRDLLPHAIQSVLDQTFQDFELLVIDNGSTDDTKSVVQAIKDGRIKYVLNPKPTQSCDAPRNLGIELAQGEFISFLDDDDVWYPEKLEKVKRVFDENFDVGAVCHYENKSVNGKIEGILKYGPWSDHFYEKLLYEGNCLSPSAMTVRTILLRQLNGFTLKKEFDAAADYDLWLRMAAYGTKIFFIREPLGECGLGGHNGALRFQKYYFNIACIIKEHLLFYEKKTFFKISYQGHWRLFSLYFLAMKAFLKHRYYSEALKCFFKSFLLALFRPTFFKKIYGKLSHAQ